MVAPFMPDDEKLAAVREGLPATGAGIYLNTGSIGPMPAETAAAMAEIAERDLRVGRATEADWLDTLQRLDEARAAVAAVLTTTPDHVALTHSATDAMNLAISSPDWRAGDEVLTTRHEHPGALGPLTVIRDRLGVTIRFVDIADDDARTLAAFEAAVGPKSRMIVASHVLWTTGAVLPVRELADLARRRGLLCVIDGAQAAGALPVDVRSIGADFYAVSAQKWLLGPEGMGALAVGPAVVEQGQPPVAGVLSFETLDLEGRGRAWPSARRWEATGFHRPSVVGFARSCGWLSMFVGLDWIHRRGAALARRAAERLAAIPNVEILTPVGRMSTLVTFRIGGWPAEMASAELGRRAFAILRTIPGLDAIRISVGFFNTEAELDRFTDAVAELARHGPESLPAGRTLTILGAGEG